MGFIKCDSEKKVCTKIENVIKENLRLNIYSPIFSTNSQFPHLFAYLFRYKKNCSLSAVLQITFLLLEINALFNLSFDLLYFSRMKWPFWVLQFATPLINVQN